jgi:hypothetical protein
VVIECSGCTTGKKSVREEWGRSPAVERVLSRHEGLGSSLSKKSGSELR